MALSHKLISVFIALGMALSSARFAVGMALCSREFHAINVVILLYHTILESTGYSTEYGFDFGGMNIYDFSGEQCHVFLHYKTEHWFLCLEHDSDVNKT